MTFMRYLYTYNCDQRGMYINESLSNCKSVYVTNKVKLMTHVCLTLCYNKVSSLEESYNQLPWCL